MHPHDLVRKDAERLFDGVEQDKANRLVVLSSAGEVNHGEWSLEREWTGKIPTKLNLNNNDDVDHATVSCRLSSLLSFGFLFSWAGRSRPSVAPRSGLNEKSGHDATSSFPLLCEKADSKTD